MSKESKELSADNSLITTVGAGLAGALVGAVLGFLFGANIGGNWFTSLTIGDLHGYEATSAIGAVVGAIVAGLGAAWLVRRAVRSRTGQPAR